MKEDYKPQWRHLDGKDGEEQLFKVFKVSNLESALTSIDKISEILVEINKEVKVLVMINENQFSISIVIPGEQHSEDRCMPYANKIDTLLPEF